MKPVFLILFQIRFLFLTALSAIVCGGALAFSALQFDAAAPGSVSRTGCAVVALGIRVGFVYGSMLIMR